MNHSEGAGTEMAMMNDTRHMRDAVFFEGPEVRQRLSKFCILITLASIIAAAGVAADSTATVIGAMIVAPLMTPILGTMLSVVLADRTNLIRSLLLLAGGGLVAITVGWLGGLVVPNEVIAETNSQVADRVNPRLVDMLAALATGAVGSVALVRRDISDTLPGVAIAISLVPPLSVVGFTFEAGKLDQSLGALLLFSTNVAAILGSGTVVMALYGFHRLVAPTPNPEGRTVNRRNAVIFIAAMVVAVSVPLTAASLTVARDTSLQTKTLAAAREFGDEVGWSVGNATTRNGVVLVHMEGPPPLPDTDRLRTELKERGVDPSDVNVELVPARLVTFD
jgi:uncharacterized hydrophobic protein (TIGR00271 family)